MSNMTQHLERVPADKWRTLSDGESQWLPLVMISQSGLWIGPDRAGAWVVGRPTGRAEKLDQRPSPSWMPLLDQDEDIFIEELRFSAERYRLSVDQLLESLPVTDIIGAALATTNPHWIDRGIQWLMHRPLPDQLVPLLERVASLSSVPQSSRQEARRILAGHRS